MTSRRKDTGNASAGIGNQVIITREHPRSDYPARVLRRRALEFMEKRGLSWKVLSITLVTDQRIAEINGEWRDKPVATDVLSFPAGDMPEIPGVPMPLGDIVISLDTAARRAGEEGNTLAAEVSRYLAHGILHLLGWDHHRSQEEAREMLRLEEELLGGVGKAMLHDSEELG